MRQSIIKLSFPLIRGRGYMELPSLICFGVPGPVELSESIVLRLAGALSTKSDLIGAYRRGLPMPGYMADNWDSFGECVMVRDWAGERNVVVVHEVLPLTGSHRDLQIYVEILADAVELKAESALRIYFASGHKAALRGLIPPK